MFLGVDFRVLQGYATKIIDEAHMRIRRIRDKAAGTSSVRRHEAVLGFVGFSTYLGKS